MACSCGLALLTRWREGRVYGGEGYVLDTAVNQFYHDSGRYFSKSCAVMRQFLVFAIVFAVAFRRAVVAVRLMREPVLRFEDTSFLTAAMRTSTAVLERCCPRDNERLQAHDSICTDFFAARPLENFVPYARKQCDF